MGQALAAQENPFSLQQHSSCADMGEGLMQMPGPHGSRAYSVFPGSEGGVLCQGCSQPWCAELHCRPPLPSIYAGLPAGSTPGKFMPCPIRIPAQLTPL